MNINIISLGKIKDKYLKLGIAEFTKRLSSYCSLSVTEIPAQEIYDYNLTDKILQNEGEKVLKKVKDNSFLIVLDIAGKQLSSEKFAEKINEISLSGINEIVFVIGSSQGLCPEVKNKADFSLSFSDMTFPHQLMRLILLEQIYRAFKILKNEQYHK